MNRKRNRAYKPAKPFEGKVKQLRKEHLILINLAEFEGFRNALINEGIEYDLGAFYNDGIIVMEK